MPIEYYKNKKIWITGASSGIGQAIAISLSTQGAYLILSARSLDKLLSTQKALTNQKSSEIVILDMERPEEIERIATQINEKHNGIDILINNAGISQRSITIDTSMEVYHRLMDVNYFGVIQMSKLLLPSMLKRGNGHIVTISSVNGKLGSYMKSGYAATKHALHGFFDSLRAEIDGSGVVITLVTPGYVQTDISLNALTKNGTPQQWMDENTAKGIPVDVFANKLIRQIAQQKHEIAIAGSLETLALYLQRYWPSMLRRITAKIKKA